MKSRDNPRDGDWFLREARRPEKTAICIQTFYKKQLDIFALCSQYWNVYAEGDSKLFDIYLYENIR